MENIQELQTKIEYLEKENKYLKSLLDNAGIFYDISLNIEDADLFDPDQGAREEQMYIVNVPSRSITER